MANIEYTLAFFRYTSFTVKNLLNRLLLQYAVSQSLKVYTSLWAMQPYDQSYIKLPYDQVARWFKMLVMMEWLLI